MAQVELIEVTKSYKHTVAVDRFNLTIRDREFMVLLGPSGCGKSSVLRMIAGLETVTDGEIYINGKLVNYQEPKDRNVAMVFQNYALYPHMTAFENIGFPLKMAGERRETIKQKVEQVAATLQLKMLLHRVPSDLSGGERQRVALGRAVVRNPSVFLMDEPLSNLDAVLRVQMRDELLDLYERLQTTLIYVTHDQMEAMTMGQRVAVLRDGVLQQVGPPQEVYDFPLNKFVAGFLGSPSMNFFGGVLERADGQLVFNNSSLRLPLGSALVEKLAAAEGKITGNVTLGIRPEDIEIISAEPPAGLQGEVHLIEPAGADRYVWIQIGQEHCVVRTSPRSALQSKQVVGLRPSWQRVHVFDSTGRNLLMSGSGTA